MSGNLSFALNPAFISTEVISDMREPQRGNSALLFAVCIMIVVYLMVGLSGAITFGTDAMEPINLMLDRDALGNALHADVLVSRSDTTVQIT